VAAVVLALTGAAVTSRVMELQRPYNDRGEKLAYMQNRFTTLEHQAQDASQRIDALSKVLNERIQLERVLDAPDLEVTRLAPLGPAPGAHAVVIVSKSSGSAVLRANGLDAPPPGKTYELWWITKQKGPVEAATFTAQSDKEVLTKVDPPPTGDPVLASAVTLEPAGGVPKPTGVMYLKGSPERE
jgi:anti-sigma-K factor RskA